MLSPDLFNYKQRRAKLTRKVPPNKAKAMENHTNLVASLAQMREDEVVHRYTTSITEDQVRRALTTLHALMENRRKYVVKVHGDVIKIWRFV